MTFLSPFLMAGLIAFIVYLTSLNNEKVRFISVLDETELFKGNFVFY